MKMIFVLFCYQFSNVISSFNISHSIVSSDQTIRTRSFFYLLIFFSGSSFRFQTQFFVPAFGSKVLISLHLLSEQKKNKKEKIQTSLRIYALLSIQFLKFWSVLFFVFLFGLFFCFVLYRICSKNSNYFYLFVSHCVMTHNVVFVSGSYEVLNI